MWLKMFENYVLVIGATEDSWPDARKRAVLLHALGTEGQILFYALSDTGKTYACGWTEKALCSQSQRDC